MTDITDISSNAAAEGAPGAALPNAIHLLRTMQAHHVTLSAMADQKANIIIGINSVIFALVVRDAASNPALMVLAATSGLAAVLCLLAVLPSIGGSTGSSTGAPNLLFFSGFTQMSEADWQAWLQKTMSDDDRINAAMAHDVYQLGLVLAHKKYRYLAWGYRVFIAGLITTFALILISALAGL